MKWTKFTLKTTTEAVDLISSMLDEIGIEGIEIEDNVPLSDADTKGMFIDILPELPPDDGAFLCENSWGTEFGKDGFFYVSYYDTNLCTTNLLYSDVEPADNYDRIYQTDLCGWLGQIGYGNENVWGANVYTASAGMQQICAAGFYSD